MYESEYMKEQLLKNNYLYLDDYKESDIVIINTCSVTNNADNKSKKIIRDVRRDNKNCILMVCGCSAENKREELNALNIDILIGNNEKKDIVNLISNYLSTKEKYLKFYNTKKLVFEDMYVTNFDSLTRAFVKIQDGCNNYCSYCIIPYVRGNIRSKEMNEVISEVNSLVSNGHKEIVLTGINTGSYGKETGKYDLTDLIQELSKIDNLYRIRISSIEITEINDKFINELKNNPKLCGHLHISLQSGSDKILKLMNRKYTQDKYYEIVKKIKDARPSVNLTTDVIVGFPNEAENDFKDTISFCQKIGFSKIHVFPYSIRKGTKASTMPNQVENKIKKERVKRLIKISEEQQIKYHQKYLNKQAKVLIEESFDTYSVGHTENFIKVIVPKKLKENEFYDVIVSKIDVDTVTANLI